MKTFLNCPPALLCVSSVAAAVLAACGGGGSSPAANVAPAATGPNGTAVALATTPPTLPTCAQLISDPAFGLVGDPTISVVTGTGTSGSGLIQNVPTRPVTNGTLPPTPDYCNINVIYTPPGFSGPADGYDVGQVPHILIRLTMPLSAADGGSGALEGSWNGGVMVSGGSGMSGSTLFSAYTEGVMRDNNEYSVRLGYVGVGTDTGQTAQGGGNFGVIQTGPLAHTLKIGALKDWEYRATKYGKDMGKHVATLYYGLGVNRTYYDGCSGGGNMGMGQLQNYGDEYDGILIGAPAFHWQEFRLADSWPNAVTKSLTQIGKTLSSGQINAANAAATAACDALDGLVDGLVSDPRSCTFSAKANICGVTGAPAAPNCLDADQAAAIDRIWAGPKNELGKRVYFPFDRGISSGGSANIGGTTSQVMQYNHLDLTFNAQLLFENATSLALAGNPAGGISYQDEALLGSNVTGDYMENASPDLSKARAHGTKVMHFHGMQDPAIRWRHSLEYYRQVAVWNSGTGVADFAALRPWYRFYAMPGVGHCGGGPNPSAIEPFRALVAWVEQGIAPDRVLAQSQPVANQPPAGRTRPLCPWPTWAQYNGTGSIDDWNSFTCAGNLDANPVALCQMPRTTPKFENTAVMNNDTTGISAALCASFDKGK